MLSVSGARGIVGRSMTPPVAAEFAAAFGSWLRERLHAGREALRGDERPSVCVGRDTRPSGGLLAGAAIAGLRATGCDVVDLGVVTTPTVGVMIGELRASGGLVVTASHNPIEWNGIKCLGSDGAAPPKAEADALVSRFRAGEIDYAASDRLGGLSSAGHGHAVHVQRVLGLVDVDAIHRRRFTVVLDSVNGAGCVPGRMLLEALGCRIEQLNGEPTGRFAHPPEPTETNLTGLCAAVRACGEAAVGFAQDPDADRLAIVDERGAWIGEEYTLVLAARRMLALRGPGALAANLSTSRMIDDVASAHPGASVLRSAVGEANVVAAMKRAGARIGGEGNGGVIVPEVCFVRDSLSAMALVLDSLAAEDRPLSAIVGEIPRYEIIKHSFEIAALGGAEAIPRLVERAHRRFAGERIDESDGIRIDVADGWVHLRPSNTEPIVRLIAEAPTRERAWELLDEVAVAAGLK